MARAVAALAATLALGLAVAGCGGGEGVAAGATVRVYVGSELCAGAQRALRAAGGKAGEVRVRAVCAATGAGSTARGTGTTGRLDLAALGADARRATEDSTAVVYLEAPGTGGDFVAPILEEAGIAMVRSGDGAAAMRRALAAIGEASDSGGLRNEVREALEAESS